MRREGLINVQRIAVAGEFSEFLDLGIAERLRQLNRVTYFPDARLRHTVLSCACRRPVAWHKCTQF
jgi:hypothetical protein